MTTTLTDSPGSSEIPRAQRRYLLRTTVSLALIIVAGFAWTVLLLGDVPDTVATHFSGSGEADSTSSPWSLITVATASAVLTLATFAAFTRGGATVGNAARFTTGLIAWTVSLLMVLQVRIIMDQRGIDDPAEASLSSTTLVWTIVLPLVIALALALLARPVPRTAPGPDDATSVADLGVPTTASVVWFRTESMSPWVQAFLYAVTGVSILACILSGIPLWSMLVLITLIALAMLTSCTWRLRIDSRGFSYRSALGIPKKQIPLDEISHAEAVTINPMEWGGWGWRLNGNGTGLITSGGPGVRITRTNRRVVDVTCSDADRALSTLKHYGVPVRGITQPR